MNAVSWQCRQFDVFCVLVSVSMKLMLKSPVFYTIKQLTWFRNIVLKISHILWTVFIRLVLHITGLWPSHGNKLEFFFKQFTTYGSIFLFRLQIIYFHLFISDTCNSYQNIFPLHRIDSFCKTISDNTFNFTNSEFSCC